jgi:hypothetical protein
MAREICCDLQWQCVVNCCPAAKLMKYKTEINLNDIYNLGYAAGARYFTNQNIQTGSGTCPASTFIDYQGLISLLVSEAHHSPLSSAEVKNDWGVYAFVACVGKTFSLFTTSLLLLGQNHFV